MTPKQQKLEEVIAEFENSFLCHEPEHRLQSSHQFAHDKSGKLLQEFEKFLRTSMASYGSFIEGEVRSELLVKTEQLKNAVVIIQDYHKALNHVLALLQNKE